MQSGEACLGVKIYREDPVATKGKILGEMCRSGRLRRTTFEICDANYLEILVASAAWKAAAIPLPVSEAELDADRAGDRGQVVRPQSAKAP